MPEPPATITVAVYFGEEDAASLRTLTAVEDCLARFGRTFEIELQRIPDATHRDVFERHGVQGIPVVDISVGGGRIRRLFGEKSSVELETALRALIELDSSEK